MDQGQGPSTQGPGWFPDPWRVAAYRWWDGAVWTPATWDVTPVPRPAGRPAVGVVLTVASALLWVWSAIWALLLPALLLSDADNGRFGHDLNTVWVPEVGLGATAAALCLVMLRVERRSVEGRSLALWKVLLAPAAATAILIAYSALVLPLGRR